MPARSSKAYTIGFAAAVCLICGTAVSALSVALAPRQDKNRELDRQRNVLVAAALIDPVADDDAISSTFRERIRAKTVGEGLTVFEVVEGGRVAMAVLPVEGKGLWSTMRGFLAVDADGTTIRGLAFYEHGETPGLGGEIENPDWTALWVGRKAFDERGLPVIEVIKGAAGPPKEDLHRVDGLSGATLTSNGVTAMMKRWLGDEGYGPYLSGLRATGGR